ncbi:MAG TPA: hypothetical protein VKN99_24705 [Polyangia bacterium]|nr:hypothetical protein [Polyangia bacterium]
MWDDSEILERKIERHFHLLLACQRTGERGDPGDTRALLGWIARSQELMITASLKALRKAGGRAPRYSNLMRAAVRLENNIQALVGSSLEGTSRSLRDLIRFCNRSLDRTDIDIDVLRLLEADVEELHDQLASAEQAQLESAAFARAAA